MQLWLVILIGLIGGAAVGLQSPIAGAMSQRVGGVAGSLIVHLSGAILSAILLVVIGGENIRDWNKLPWYMLLSGIFGLILYQTISVTLPQLGGTMMIVLVIVGQLAMGVIVDQFGLLGVAARPLDLPRLLGILLLIFGAYLVAK